MCSKSSFEEALRIGLKGGTVSQSLIDKYVDLMQKVQLLADVAGRKRMSIELQEQGIERNIQEQLIQEQVIQEKVNGTAI